jgi:hypothetical protein
VVAGAVSGVMVVFQFVAGAFRVRALERKQTYTDKNEETTDLKTALSFYLEAQ